MTTVIKDFHTELVETIKDIARYNKWWSSPINLGGVPGISGGVGGPVGGIFGQLIQTKVSYDTSEEAYSGIMTNVPSGTLVDNLAHLRYRLTVLEEGGVSGNISIKENGVLVASGITIIDFIGADVEIVGPTEITVTFSGVSGSCITAVGTLVYENLVTQIDGANQHFLITTPALSGYFGVYLNGLRQDEDRYTIDVDWQGFITTFTPDTPDTLYAQYVIASGTSGTGDVSSTSFAQHKGMWTADSTVLVGNDFSFVGDGTHEYVNYWYQNPPADGDSFEQSFNLKSGIYNITFVGVTDSNRGIQDIYVDDTYITSLNWYSPGNTVSVKQTVSGVNIDNLVYHTLKSIVNGKDGASGDYYIAEGRVIIKPV